MYFLRPAVDWFLALPSWSPLAGVGVAIGVSVLIWVWSAHMKKVDEEIKGCFCDWGSAFSETLGIFILVVVGTMCMDGIDWYIVLLSGEPPILLSSWFSQSEASSHSGFETTPPQRIATHTTAIGGGHCDEQGKRKGKAVHGREGQDARATGR